MPITAQRSEIVFDLFEKYYDRVYCFVRRSLPADAAEDIAQEVFMRLLKHKNLEKLTLSVSYLIKIADNLIKRRYQRSQRFGRYLEATKDQRQDSVRDATNASRMPALDTQTLDSALGRLTCDERNAVHLIVCRDMSYEDAARSLGVSVSTINNWKYRGLRKLKDHVQEPACSKGPTVNRRDHRKQESGPLPAARGDRRQPMPARTHCKEG